MADLNGKKIALVATHGFEQSELFSPLEALKAAGAQVDVISLEPGEIRGWNEKDWGRSVKLIGEVSATDYDALLLPGGQINPDLLRVEEKVLNFVRDMNAAGKPIAAICHAPWLLIEAGIAKGLKATSYKSIRTDMINAGVDWADEPVVVDQGIVTSRNPGDLEAFNAKVIEEVAEGRHESRRVA